MTSPDAEPVADLSAATSRHLSPPPSTLRHRPLGRAATFAEPSTPLNRRRSSVFSDSLSDAKRSLRSSTDDLLRPSASRMEEPYQHDSSHWHSLPLGLALLPAVGGMIFKDGSAVVTDLMLLGLASIFMNWFLRIPWDWYQNAQVLVMQEPASPGSISPIIEEDESQLEQDTPPTTNVKPLSSFNAKASRKDQFELSAYEMLALLSCFLGPACAAWMLHAIRSSLSRPREGLVSNYNLTIFFLVAELRPASHLIKLTQKRTLFLQRKVSFESLQDSVKARDPRVGDLQARVEELEAHIANGIAASDTQAKTSPDVIATQASAQAITEVRRSVQPEVEALSRAMRRYEKRTTVSAVQFDSRLQDLEASLKDVVVLAAAAQRTVEQRPTDYAHILLNWLASLVVVPLQIVYSIITLPISIWTGVLEMVSRYLPFVSRPKKVRVTKSGRRLGKGAVQEEKKPK